MADDKKDLYSEGLENSLEGKSKDLKGRMKDAVGGLTGDTELQAEGKWDRLKGNVQDEFGEFQRELSDDDEDDIVR
jgi:uncharacterized protein YjbJ (UPF0337 family)